MNTFQISNMFRLLLLLLVLMSSTAFAQTPDEIPQASKFDEFETATNGYVKMIMDGYYVQLDNNPSVQGYVVNYGTDKEIAIREKQIRNSIVFRKFDATRITIIKGGFRGKVKTDLWLVPVGAENPTLEAVARKFDEFGEAAQGDIKARMDSFFTEIINNPNVRGYLINYGTNSKNLERERYIKNYAKNRNFDVSKIDFAKFVSKSRIKTVLWIVPEGAEVPKP